MADTVIQATDTTFARQGFSVQQKGYLLPGTVNSALTNAIVNSGVGGGLLGQVFSSLLGISGQNTEIIPGGLSLYNIHALSPSTFQGSGDLQAIWQRDPWGTEYETETEELYERSFAVARAAAQSGPSNVRGGTARQAIELAELDTLQSITRFREVWQTQLAMAQIVTQAVEVHNRIETDYWRLQLNAQQLQAGTEQGKAQQVIAACEVVNKFQDSNTRNLAAGAEFFGVPLMRTDESLRGVGFQSGVQTSFGMSSWR
jgi:hypothetical protein